MAKKKGGAANGERSSKNNNLTMGNGTPPPGQDEDGSPNQGNDADPLNAIIREVMGRRNNVFRTSRQSWVATQDDKEVKSHPVDSEGNPTPEDALIDR